MQKIIRIGLKVSQSIFFTCCPNQTRSCSHIIGYIPGYVGIKFDIPLAHCLRSQCLPPSHALEHKSVRVSHVNLDLLYFKQTVKNWIKTNCDSQKVTTSKFTLVVYFNQRFNVFCAKNLKKKEKLENWCKILQKQLLKFVPECWLKILFPEKKKKKLKSIF